MSDLSDEVRVQVARLRHLLIDVGRRGIFSSPLAAPPEVELEPLHFETLWWLRAEGFLTINALAERLGGWPCRGCPACSTSSRRQAGYSG